jgi:hypothetical protein
MRRKSRPAHGKKLEKVAAAAQKKHKNWVTPLLHSRPPLLQNQQHLLNAQRIRAPSAVFRRHAWCTRM